MEANSADSSPIVPICHNRVKDEALLRKEVATFKAMLAWLNIQGVTQGMYMWKTPNFQAFITESPDLRWMGQFQFLCSNYVDLRSLASHHQIQDNRLR